MVNMPRLQPKKKFVMPAQAGIQVAKNENVWIRAGWNDQEKERIFPKRQIENHSAIAF